jgi:hypothetical protein
MGHLYGTTAEDGEPSLIARIDGRGLARTVHLTPQPASTPVVAARAGCVAAPDPSHDHPRIDFRQ